ncbi:LysR substrate-binding domain-containing protein [Archangium violaceum]|uniref:LysR substrate-binding domain-containing protein n=1 Tax=Archangium violaceum TaxID=83451 RepID=UPI0037C137FE
MNARRSSASNLGEFELGLYAHPAYLARRPAPNLVAELNEHAFVGFDVGAPYTRTLQLGGQPLTREQFTFRSDNDLAQLAAIRAGCGIGACHVALAQRSGLVRILPEMFAPTVEMWVAMHEDLRTTARYRTVFDALTTGLKAYLREPVDERSAPVTRRKRVTRKQSRAVQGRRPSP